MGSSNTVGIFCTGRVMGLDIFEKITNTYERKARLYPAAITLIPVFALVIGHYGHTFKLETSVIGLLSSFGVFYLAASIARESGKRLENTLFNEWGGKPTTQIQRHRDNTIDSVTKARYHSFLAEHMGIKFPSLAEEKADPVAADEIYQSATKWLLDRTRDQKTFELLFQENVAFGFRRNCLGLKPFAIAVAVLTFLGQLILTGVLDALEGINTTVFHGLPLQEKASLLVSLFMLIVWVFFFTKKTVRTAAFAYADLLLRACDTLPKKK